MNPFRYASLLGLLSITPLFAAEDEALLSKDMAAVTELVESDAKNRVADYLRTGTSNLGVEHFVSVSAARNALRRIEKIPQIIPALGRIMHHHASRTDLADDSRQYAFAMLRRLAAVHSEVAKLAQTLAAQCAAREQDPLKKAAERFLRESQSNAEQAMVFPAEKLAGQWRQIDRERGLVTTLTFNKDGTYSGNIEANGQVDWTFSGTWNLQGKSLNYEYTASSRKGIPAGTKDRDTLIELTENAYTIENAGGVRETYLRVK